MGMGEKIVGGLLGVAVVAVNGAALARGRRRSGTQPAPAPLVVVSGAIRVENPDDADAAQFPSFVASGVFHIAAERIDGTCCTHLALIDAAAMTYSVSVPPGVYRLVAVNTARGFQDAVSDSFQATGSSVTVDAIVD